MGRVTRINIQSPSEMSKAIESEKSDSNALSGRLHPIVGHLPPPDKRLPPLDETIPEGWCALQAACVHRLLDERGVQRSDGDGTLTLWGRVMRFGSQYANLRHMTDEPPRPNDPALRARSDS